MAWFVTAGCSSSKNDSTPQNADAEVVCPNTLVATQGSACVQEGFICHVGYACTNGNFLNEQAHCTCTGGKYACADSTDKPIDDPANPPCTAPGGGNDKDCPADEKTAEGQSCKTAGLQCFYAGEVCPDTGKPNTDVCQCVGGGTGATDGAPSLLFKCEPQLCSPKSDGGIPIPLDGGGKDTGPG